MVAFKWIPSRSSKPQYFFSRREKKSILRIIQQLEKETSAEIRIHVEKKDKALDCFAQAKLAFEKIGMTRTAARNGVLIFILSDSREFALLGDKGIDEKVPVHFWQRAAAGLEESFRQEQFLAGIKNVLSEAAHPLKTHFPRAAGDQNELPDGVSHP